MTDVLKFISFSFLTLVMKINFRIFAINVLLFGTLYKCVSCLNQSVYQIKISREKAKEWLMKQQKQDFSWGLHTQRAIVALSLSTENFTSNTEENRLMVKQLQTQLIKELRTIDSLPPYQIALYIQALLAICLDPRDFHGYNLVEELNKKLKTVNTVNPFIKLALCNAKFEDNLRLKFYKKIMTKSQHPKWEDAKAWLIMTFICSIQNVIEDLKKNSSDYTLLINYIDEISDTFNTIKEGSIQNIRSIAIIAQVLFSLEKIREWLNITEKIDWHKENVIKYLLDHQQEDGSFGDIINTYLVLPVLFEKSLLDLKFTNCESVNFTQEIDIKREPKIAVNYSIWIGKNKEFQFKMVLKVSSGLSFYDIMLIASKLDGNFKFKYFKYSGGIYVYSLAGVVNEPESDESWQLYSLKEDTLIHIDESPDKIFPKNKENFIFWYTTSTHLLIHKLK